MFGEKKKRKEIKAKNITLLDFLVLGLLVRTTFRAFCWSADTQPISESAIIVASQAAEAETQQQTDSSQNLTRTVSRFSASNGCPTLQLNSRVIYYCTRRCAALGLHWEFLSVRDEQIYIPRGTERLILLGVFCVRQLCGMRCVFAGWEWPAVARQSLSLSRGWLHW